jgi:LytS/YehU family sensor histidine kinase
MVGSTDGLFELDGENVGTIVGDIVLGEAVGNVVGVIVGSLVVGSIVGILVGVKDGETVGFFEVTGAAVGRAVGATHNP